MNRELISTVAVMIAMFVFEGVFPFFKTHKKHLQHTAINVLFGIGNGGLSYLLFAGVVLSAVNWASLQSVGILHIIPLSWTMQCVISFLLFDLWMYWWHRLNHERKFLWAFHSMHHTDLEMDASSAYRFHPGEKILSSLVRLLVIPILGMQLIHFAIYNIVMSPLILFHHSNIALPEKIDKILRAVIVTPNMHRVHHSKNRIETDSNYASVFSFWDRIFNTFREVKDTSTIVYGLEKMREPWWQTAQGMIATPLYTSGILKIREDVTL